MIQQDLFSTRRPPTIRIHADDLIVDSFAGGGGASTGIEWALGRSPDIAVNHDPEAIAMHAANHPSTRHLVADVFDVNPRQVTAGRRVALAWFSPDCTFHSKARGGKPFRDPNEARGRRGLAGVVIKWAAQVKPRVIALENVEEWLDWSPLVDGRPDPARKGLSFRIWLGKLKAQGYVVEWRELRACDYGAPTTRKRLFVIARCDGEPIVWPEPTHGPGRIPYRSAASCIDWAIPAPSIFARAKPLVDNTLRRIARGMERFVLNCAEPFIVPMTHPRDQRVYDIGEPFRTITSANRGEFGLIAPTLYQSGYGEREGQAPRVLDIGAPLTTVVSGGVKHGLAVAFMAKHFGGHSPPGISVAGPFSTITTQDHHALVSATALPPGTSPEDRRDAVRAFLIQYNGTSDAKSLRAPLGTVTTRDRFGLVTVAGHDYEIADIGQRMLAPRELYRGQGFPDSYIIDPVFEGRPLSLTSQVRMCGNSVSPYMSAAIAAANLGRQERRAA